MSQYNFDEVIDRKGTDCLKYDFAVQRGQPEGVLPFWIADMDFRVAQPILDELHKRIDHGIFGYSDTGEAYFQALKNWQKKYFDWDIESDWLVKTPGVVPAINVAVRALTEVGDGVLVNRPVYYPFLAAIQNNGRKLVNSPLVLKDGHYEIDFDDLEQKIIDKNVKVAILCSPHNPVGRVWTKEELTKYAKICEKYGVIIIADEIHQDFSYEGHPHTTFATISPYAKDSCIICTAPSKTFNIAGLQCSNIFIPDRAIRELFRKELECFGYDQINLMAIAACQAAYEGGETWLTEVKAYIKGNKDFTRAYLAKHLPEMKLIEPEGTYLLWLDASFYTLDDKELERKIVHDGNLWVDMGTMFGPEGSGFFRFNIACPRATLELGLAQLVKAFK